MPASRPLRRTAVAAALLGVLVTGTACGAGSELRGALSSPAGPSPSPVSSPVSGPPAPAPAGPADPAAPAGPCTGAGLAVSLGPTTGAGDDVAGDLILQNTGGSPCVLRGFPLVVAVAGNDGVAVGDPALPVGERGSPVRLEPRAAATVPLRLRDPAAYDGDECRPRPVRGLRVAPPGGSGSVFVPREATACSGERLDPPQATVGTVVAR